MGLGVILPVSAVVTTVILVVITDAHPAVKLVASLLCAATFLVPRTAPSLAVLAGPAQAALSIAVILFLKAKNLID